MTNPSKIVVEVPLPREVHTALKEVAAEDDRSIASAIRIAIKRYIENPKGVVTNPVKEVAKPAGSPQQRAAQTKAERAAEKKKEKKQAWYNTLPEFSSEGYAIYRGELSDWTPVNPGEGYTAVPSSEYQYTDAQGFVRGCTIRVPGADYEASQYIVDNRYKADLPEGLEDIEEDDD